MRDGAPVFAGTTVLLETLWEYRRAGAPLYEFLLDFPAVRKAHARRLWAWLDQVSAAQVRKALSQARARRSAAVAAPGRAGL